MRAYQCHKRVKAAKILEVVSDHRLPPDYRIIRFQSANAPDGIDAMTADASMIARYVPVVGDYVVEYEPDEPGKPPYRSISPKKVFEAGYRLIPDSLGKSSDTPVSGQQVSLLGSNTAPSIIDIAPCVQVQLGFVVGRAFEVWRKTGLGPMGHAEDAAAWNLLPDENRELCIAEEIDRLKAFPAQIPTAARVAAA